MRWSQGCLYRPAFTCRGRLRKPTRRVPVFGMRGGRGTAREGGPGVSFRFAFLKVGTEACPTQSAIVGIDDVLRAFGSAF